MPDRDRDVEVVLVPKPKAVAQAHKSAPPQAPPPVRPQQPKRVSDLRTPFE